jgi:hypothetical protein
MSSLDASIRNLLKVINQIQAQSTVNSGDFLKASKPYWHLCTEKFHAAYIKAKNPDGFRDMFLNFFSKNEDKFIDDVVADEEINDEWLKCKDVITINNKNKKKKSSDEFSFSLRNINCRGHVIYFDETNEKIRNVCIPIGEAYIAAVKIYTDGAKKGEYSPLPAQLLLALFTVMSYVVEEEDKESLDNNVKALKDVVDQLTEGDEGEDDGTGSTLNPLGNVMKTIAKKFNLGSDGNFDMSSIEKMTSNLFNSETVDKAKGIFSKFQEKANIKEGADLSTIISGVSEALKSDDLQNEIKGALAEVASKVGFSIPEFNEAEKSAINGNDGTVATEQE